ncbi:DUF2795 domain-containing protein [Halorubrum sp. JWXQ-INN 858]|uniref:DUF5789 family protein n=1 Tax=Halorubrum sp. JWXQ-INN 858 TaxID=2690782 RepID=UPI0013579ABA|nr:DUF2795 domain-containing protein [Halorubrum sp. JWXQ-INN 858]MWV63494.1 DUF2795 domain-containing protein [Halorubrum sp. JWXQ-INN 858]
MRLNGIDDRLERHQYPMTSAEIIAAHGNATVELADGTERLGDVLELFGEQTFDRPDEVFDTLRAGVCHRAVGRRFYSDRDPATAGERGSQPVSF